MGENIETWVALAFLFVAVSGVAFGMGFILLFQRHTFKRREDELYTRLREAEFKIQSLQAQVTVLIRALDEKGIVPKTGPLASATIDIRGNVTGRDENMAGSAVTTGPTA